MTERSVSTLQAVGEARYRESHGLYFDDFVVGDVYEHRPGRTITEADNIWQSLLNHNSNPLHFDNVYAETTEFGRALVSSLVTFSLVNGLTVGCISARAIANLGWKEVRLTAPVFVGDTIYAESTVLAKRLSEKRAGQGIVTVESRGVKADGTVVIVFERSVLLPLREGR